LQDRRNENEISTLRQLQQCAENNLESEEVQFCSKLVENFKTVLKKVSQAEGRDKINSNTLVWDTTHSVVDKISLSTSGVLTIYYSGYYLIQSQVTFSSADEKAVLKQSLLTQRPNETGPTELLQSYCSLPRKARIPDMCTASQAGVFKLEKDQRLYITVNNRSLVHHDSTTFGLFRLQY
ncbi:CD40 ligand, partial [Silurus asotus]